MDRFRKLSPNVLRWPMRVLLLLFFIFIGTDSPLQGQEFSIRVNRYQNVFGIEARNLSGIVKDANGVVWLGSYQGLYRFNGYDFDRVSGMAISHIVTDEQSRIWVASEDRLYQLQLEPFTVQAEPNFNQGKISRLVYDSDRFLIATEKGIYSYPSGGSPTLLFDFNQLPKKSSTDVAALGMDKHGSLAFRLFDGLEIHLDSQGNVVYQKGMENGKTNFVKMLDGDLWREDRGRITILKNGLEVAQLPEKPLADQVYKAEYVAGELVLVEEESRPVSQLTNLFRQPLGKQAWFFSNQGSILYRLNAENNQLIGFDLSDLDMIEPQPLWLDPDGVLWLAAYEGLFSVNIRESHFKWLLHHEAGGPVSTRAIFENGNKVSVASYSGVYDIDEQGRTSRWQDNLIQVDSGAYPIDEAGMSIYAALSEEDKIWFLSDSKGLFQYTPSKGIYEHYHSGGHAFGYDFLRSESGALWICVAGGVWRVDEQARSIVPLSEMDSLLANHWVFDLKKDRNSEHAWAASSKGIHLLDLEKVQVVKSFAPAQNGVQADVVALYQGQNRIIWAITKNLGLLSLNPDSGETNFFDDQSHGLSDKRLVSIEAESDSVLWLGSFNGLIRFSTISHEVEVFFEDDGLTNNEFNQGSSYRADDGRMYFGGIRGVNAFYPRDLIKSKVNSQVIINNFEKYNGKTESLDRAVEEFFQHRELHIAPHNDFLVLDFSLNDYVNPEQNEFAYRWSGGSQPWVNLGRQHVLQLPKPPPGKHELLIRGRGTYGSWSQPKTLLIVSKPAYHQQPLFWLIVGLSLALLVVLFIRWRVQSLTRTKERLEQTVQERTEAITAQKELLSRQAEKLKQLDETKSRFFANISHELRTPLTLILGHTTQLLESANAQEFLVKTGLEVTQKNAQSLLALIEEIMELSKLQAGKILLNKKLARPYAMVSRLADVFQTACRQKSIEFKASIDFPKELAMIIDQSSLEKVLNNLLSNALKFTASEGEISFMVQVVDKELIIEISDNGRGIHPDDLPHIFERFYQSQQKDTPIEGGTGIGLSLAYELVLLMEGQISVQSELHKGSTFSLSIPVGTVADDAPMTAVDLVVTGEHELTTENPEPYEEGVGDQPTILLVEDHTEMRAYIAQVLRKEYSLLEASNGKEALKQMESQTVDLVVSDLMMPEMDGLQLVAQMKGNATLKPIPVILLTARADVKDKLDALALGVNEYMLKPFNPNELIVRCKNLLAFKNERINWMKEASAKEPGQPPAQDAFTKKAEEIVLNQMKDHRFGVIDLAEAMLTSQRSLARKLKQSAGMSPGQFIVEVRLQEARKMLELETDITIAEVMYSVGFQSGGYFSGQFKKRFGKRPSDYRTESGVMH